MFDNAKNKKCYVKYFYYLLYPLFDYQKSNIPGYMQPSLRVEDLNRFYDVLPPLPIQRKIASFLDTKCQELDNLISDIGKQIADYLDAKCPEIADFISDKEKQLDILKEYNKNLINEYVISKKLVCIAENIEKE